LLLDAGMFGATVGAVLGALVVVCKGVVPDLWRQGNLTDLLWIVAGAFLGAVVVLVWGKLRKEKLKPKWGIWAGGIIGALVIAPSSVLAGALPASAALGALCLVGTALAIALNVKAMGKSSLLGSLLTGGVFGAYVGVAMRLTLSVIEAAGAAGHGQLGRAFVDFQAHVASDAMGVATLTCGLIVGMLGLLLYWRFYTEHRMEPSQNKT
jgi:hypothetical protein